MKNKGVIFSIIFILCVGVFVTNYTRRLVSSGNALEMSIEEAKNAASAAGLSEMAVAQAETETDLVAPALLSADEGVAIGEAAFSAPAADSRESESAEKEKSTSESTVISPLTGVAGAVKATKKEVASSEDYRKKLQDIDEQIKKMKDSGVEPSTDSYKNIADYEYRLWDNELNTVYQDILDRMAANEADVLRADEREWMKLRDRAAHKAISKYNGGTMESLEYTASMADSTRTRVYALLENYGGYLD